MVDLTKLVMHSGYPSFKNNRVYEGSFNLSGSYVHGSMNTRTHTVNLDRPPDLVDLTVNMRTVDHTTFPPVTSTNRWSHASVLGFAPSTNVSIPSFGSNEMWWLISGRVRGQQLIITASSMSPYDTSVSTGTISTTPINYRIVDYSVAGGETSGDKLNFDSRFNYLKKSDELSGSASISIPSEGGSTNFHVINHNLGYVPFFSVGSNINNTSIIWSGNRVHSRMNSSGSPQGTPTELTYWATTTQLHIGIDSGWGSGYQSGNRQVWWNIYRDYSS